MQCKVYKVKAAGISGEKTNSMNERWKLNRKNVVMFIGRKHHHITSKLTKQSCWCNICNVQLVGWLGVRAIGVGMKRWFCSICKLRRYHFAINNIYAYERINGKIYEIDTRRYLILRRCYNAFGSKPVSVLWLFCFDKLVLVVWWGNRTFPCSFFWSSYFFTLVA